MLIINPTFHNLLAFPYYVVVWYFISKYFHKKNSTYRGTAILFNDEKLGSAGLFESDYLETVFIYFCFGPEILVFGLNNVSNLFFYFPT